MALKPIPPKPDRKWPPPHRYMDENGNWWEAPDKPWMLSPGEDLCVWDAIIVSGNGGNGIHMMPNNKPVVLTNVKMHDNK